MIQSGGLIVKKADIVYWRGTPDRLDGYALDLIGYSTSYSALYRTQPWVAAPVNKIAGATARLPLKVYKRVGDGREDGRDTPYGQLIAKPNSRIDRVTFWEWVRATWDIYGESFLGKVRDRGGRPVELVPLHPMLMRYDENGDGKWSYDDGKRRVQNIPRRDLIHFRHFNPDSIRGLSPLEPLRSTLENEQGSRRANSTMWNNGARPGGTLNSTKLLTDEAKRRLAVQWSDIHGSVDNWSKTAVLEEGMTYTPLPLNVEELQYIESRKLNREEVCAVYDIPPPVLHILDRATFSNITEQMRSMYRDTMGPKLAKLEATLDMELRDGSLGNGEPDFGRDVYAEFLLDEVLRGDFETRSTAYATAINNGWMTSAEVRAKENLPFVEGSDQLLINSTLVPINAAARPAPVPEHLALPAPKTIPADVVRSLMGRLGRVKSLADVDLGQFTAGLNGDGATVAKVLGEAVDAGENLEQFKLRLKELAAHEPAPPEPSVVNNTFTIPPVQLPDTVKMPTPIVNVPAPIVEVHPTPVEVVIEPAPPKTTVRRVIRDELGRIERLIEEQV